MESIEIKWPSGKVQLMQDVNPDQILKLVESE